MVIEHDYYKQPFNFCYRPEYLVFADRLESAGICEALGHSALVRLNDETRRLEGGIPKAAFFRLACKTGIEKDTLEAILKIGIDCGIVVAEGETVAGAVALESLGEMNAKSGKCSKAGKASAEARRQKADEANERSTDVQQTFNERSTDAGIDIDIDIENRDRIESKSAGSVSQAKPAPPVADSQEIVFHLEDGSPYTVTQGDVENLHKAYPVVSCSDIWHAVRVAHLCTDGKAKNADEIRIYISRNVKEKAGAPMIPPDRVLEWKEQKEREEAEQGKPKGKTKKQSNQAEIPVVLNEQQTAERKASWDSLLEAESMK